MGTGGHQHGQLSGGSAGIPEEVDERRGRPHRGAAAPKAVAMVATQTSASSSNMVAIKKKQLDIRLTACFIGGS